LISQQSTNCQLQSKGGALKTAVAVQQDSNSNGMGTLKGKQLAILMTITRQLSVVVW